MPEIPSKPYKKGSPIQIIKCDYAGNHVWEYSGQVIRHEEDLIVVEAFFDYHKEVNVAGLILKPGDRMIEKFFTRKWYNIFEVYEQKQYDLKGWYCNITYPTILQQDTILYRDLALDLIAFPNGKTILVDEDEFQELPLPQEDIQQALESLEELRQQFSPQEL